MGRQRFFRMLSALLLGGILLPYNNCAPNRPKELSSTSSFSCDGLDEMSLFSQTYHPFLQSNCVNCHSGGGPGPGAFASSGIQLALTSFETLTFSRINTKALDGHSPTSGVHNTDVINNLTARYVEGLQTLQNCTKDDPDLNEDQDGQARIQFKSVPINPNPNPNQTVTVRWNLRNDVVTAPNTYVPADMNGVTLEADVQVFQRPGILNYIISNPRILSTNRDIQIESLLFKINGTPTPAQRAFYLVNKNLRAWNSVHPDFTKTPTATYQRAAQLVSGGSLVALGEVRRSDVISVSVKTLRAITLPPPDLGPRIRFGSPGIDVQEGYRIVDIPIELDRVSEETISAVVRFGPATTVKDECCRTIRNDDGNNIQVAHFDRDIQDYDTNVNTKINQRLTYGTNSGSYLVAFTAGQTQTSLRIKVLDDDRQEGTEVLELEFDPSRMNNYQAGTSNQTFRLRILDNDGPYTGTAETFSELMIDGGLLSSECLRCHNSVEMRGGYDMTNYFQMVDRGILFPGSPSRGQMFLRMDVLEEGRTPMPLTGLLPPMERSRVSSWIQQGAKNN